MTNPFDYINSITTNKKNMMQDSENDALAEKGVDIRLFGKPTSFKKRRMGVVIASALNIEVAREKATNAAKRVKPIKN